MTFFIKFMYVFASCLPALLRYSRVEWGNNSCLKIFLTSFFRNFVDFEKTQELKSFTHVLYDSCRASPRFL